MSETEVTQSELENLFTEISQKSISQANETVIKDIKELKDLVAANALKNIFPAGNAADGEMQTKDGSVINTDFYAKAADFLKSNQGSSAADFAQAAMSFGGPFKKLSPTMEAFGAMVKAMQSPMAMREFNLDGYKKMCADQRKAYSMKDSTGEGENVGTSGASATVPVEYAATVIEFAVKSSKLLPRLMRIPMIFSSLKIPKLLQGDGDYFGGVAISMGRQEADAATAYQSSVGFQQLSFTANEMYALIPVTNELIADSIINMVNYVTSVLIRATMYKMEYYVINGSGNSQPLGILNDPTIERIGRQTASTIGYADVVNLEGAVDEMIDDNLVFLTRRKAINLLRAEKDSQKQPLIKEVWGMNALGQATMPTKLFNRDYIVSRNVPAVGSKGDLIICDPSLYVLAVKQDMQIAIDTSVGFKENLTWLRMIARFDGKPGAASGFKILDSTVSS